MERIYCNSEYYDCYYYVRYGNDGRYYYCEVIITVIDDKGGYIYLTMSAFLVSGIKTA